jgi:hypothetical protein
MQKGQQPNEHKPGKSRKKGKETYFQSPGVDKVVRFFEGDDEV